jgi:riboflavin synthase alpha subunit
MFTGIIREVGRVRSVRSRAGVAAIEIEGTATAPGLAVGDSVAVNGVCLTVTSLRGSRFHVDLSPETLRATTAGFWRPGRVVHLEPSLRASDPLGGHFVLGHVDDVGRVVGVRLSGASRQVEIAAPPHVLAALLPKGSIAVDGVSLTLDAGPFVRSFTVTLIPQTLRTTRLASLRTGDRVNLEADVLAKAGRGAAGSRVPAAERSSGMTVGDVLSRGWRRTRLGP